MIVIVGLEIKRYEELLTTVKTVLFCWGSKRRDRAGPHPEELRAYLLLALFSRVTLLAGLWGGGICSAGILIRVT